MQQCPASGGRNTDGRKNSERQRGHSGIVEGKAIVCPGSITGWGGIDPETGVIKDYENSNKGMTIKDSILIMPGSKGSNGWSCYFGAARAAGCAPKGWAFTRIDSSAGVASAVMQIPTVVDFPLDADPCKVIKTGGLCKTGRGKRNPGDPGESLIPGEK